MLRILSAPPRHYVSLRFGAPSYRVNIELGLAVHDGRSQEAMLLFGQLDVRC